MTETQIDRRLPWDACYNVRHLGAFVTTNQQQTNKNGFVRSDNLARLSAMGQQSLRDYGVTTIIDLRDAYELDIDPPPFAPTSGQDGYPTYHHLPLMNADDEVGIKRVYELKGGTLYCWMIDRFGPNIAAILKTMAQAARQAPNGTILIHCHAGRDRTGIIMGLLLALVGVAPKTIAQDYAISNTYIQPTFEKPLTEQPEIMLEMLAHLDSQYGGVANYLLQAGMTEQELDQLRSHLLA
ncbi:MAG: tyrosine-protein phosphatase [Chloroflexota bacterium]